MKIRAFNIRLLGGILSFCLFNAVEAGAPMWTFTPLTATTIAVPSNDTAIVQYLVTNQSSKTHTLSMQSIKGISQLTTGNGICGNPFILTPKSACTLSLRVDGELLNSPVFNGPIVCQLGSTSACYRPSVTNILRITQAPPITNATISVTGSPLSLTTNGSTGILIINNLSLNVTATNIQSNFAGTGLDGYVTETGNTCANVPPQASCTLTYTTGNTGVSLTNFPIQGSNTNTITASIQIDQGVTLTNISPASGAAAGGTGVTLTGTALSGTTSVTFGGIAATSVNVVDSTTVTAVTPAHAVGAVDVQITTPAGSDVLTNGYTYLATAVGQPAYGGIIACLNGGLNNLIAANADNSANIQWGGVGITTNATSTTDGASNTDAMIATLGNNALAAKLCDNYEIDSQGHTPCQAGNTCYSDWFLPAGDNSLASGQLNCLYTNHDAIGNFTNGPYWSSTEFNETFAYHQYFDNGSQNISGKAASHLVRCVRLFTP